MDDADARGDAGKRLRKRGPRRSSRQGGRGWWRRGAAGLTWLVAVAALTLPQGAAAAKTGPNPITFSDASGAVATYSTTGPVDLQGPFFQLLGSNGRSCSTCHSPQAGWSITPTDVQARFAATGGLEPVFRLVDGANSPRADVSTVAARRAA